jgi:APA family basic amino acid/polyamine antiporter
MMPKAGGQYVYLREAWSPMWGFLYGWTLFLVIQTGTIAAWRSPSPGTWGAGASGLADGVDREADRLSTSYAVSLSTRQLVGIALSCC